MKEHFGRWYDVGYAVEGGVAPGPGYDVEQRDGGEYGDGDGSGVGYQAHEGALVLPGDGSDHKYGEELEDE